MEGNAEDDIGEGGKEHKGAIFMCLHVEGGNRLKAVYREKNQKEYLAQTSQFIDEDTRKGPWWFVAHSVYLWHLTK